MSVDTEKTVLNLYDNGWTAQEIAYGLKLSLNDVEEILDNNNKKEE